MNAYYFSHCQTIEEARSLYRSLAKQHHPDIGGNVAVMQEINSQWAAFQASWANRSERQRQTEAHAAGRKTAADFHNLDEVTEILRVKILYALNLHLDVELCGLWVWVSGNTREHKEELKAEGFRWSPDKTAWYYPGVPSFNRTRRSMDEIRTMHGSTRFAKPEETVSQTQSLNA